MKIISTRFFTHPVLSFALFLYALGATQAVSADIKRSCIGQIYTQSSRLVDKLGRNTNVGGRVVELAIQLEGKGSCRNRLKANDCRRRAKDVLNKCAQEIWNERWDKNAPKSYCSQNFNTTSRAEAVVKSWGPNAANRVKPSLHKDVKKIVEYNACCKQHPSAKRVWSLVRFQTIPTEYRSRAQTRACSSEKVFSPDYHSDCEKLRRQGLCGPVRTNPGS